MGPYPLLQADRLKGCLSIFNKTIWKSESFLILMDHTPFFKNFNAPSNQGWCHWGLEKVFMLAIWIFMPVPSASSKIIFTTFKFFWACSIFFERSQIFWSWSKARFYLINLHIWAWSKIFEHIQKILNTVKNIWTWSKNIWTSRWIRHKNHYRNMYL